MQPCSVLLHVRLASYSSGSVRLHGTHPNPQMGTNGQHAACCMLARVQQPKPASPTAVGQQLKSARAHSSTACTEPAPERAWPDRVHYPTCAACQEAAGWPHVAAAALHCLTATAASCAVCSHGTACTGLAPVCAWPDKLPTCAARQGALQVGLEMWLARRNTRHIRRTLCCQREQHMLPPRWPGAGAGSTAALRLPPATVCCLAASLRGVGTFCAQQLQLLASCTGCRSASVCSGCLVRAGTTRTRSPTTSCSRCASGLPAAR